MRGMASSEKRERRSHFRGKPRPGRRVEVSYQVAGQSAETARTAHTRNIGVGGAFIVTATPEASGAMLRLALRVPTSRDPIEVKAEVRWNTPGDGTGEPPGMGVKFLGLEVDELLLLNEYFASLTGKEEAPQN
jgi:uncharacterized protein (TIGR02266 family)